LKDKELTEDDVRKGESMIQELTDRFVGKIDEMIAAKERELMEI